MREYMMKDIKPSRLQKNKVNKLILAQRWQRATIMRDNASNREELLLKISIGNWQKLIKKGKIIGLGSREWAMEWDI